MPATKDDGQLVLTCMGAAFGLTTTVADFRDSTIVAHGRFPVQQPEVAELRTKIDRVIEQAARASAAIAEMERHHQ